jgi:hypothetical protein
VGDETLKRKLKKGTNPQAKPSSAVSLPAVPWDMGAIGKANQDGLVREGRPFVDPETGKKTNPNGIYGMRRQSWIDRYLRNGTITIRQANAARSLYAASQGKLRQDPLAAMRIDRSHDSHDPEASAFDARRDFHRMWGMISDHAKPVVERVVLNDLPAWDGKTTGRSLQRHLQRLSDGLNELADKLDLRRAA